MIGAGQLDIQRAIERFENYEIVSIVDKKSEIKEALLKVDEPEILLLSEGLPGKELLTQVMIEISKLYPNLRIVYLAGEVNFRDERKVQTLAMLVMSGIYDIVMDKTITFTSLKNALDHRKSYESVEYIINGFKSKTDESSLVEFEIPKEETEDDGVYQNVFAFSSIKPGTGKTFVSTNVATAIAEYGVMKNGKKPRVALIEADLQNLSVGTLLQIEDSKHNLKTVMDKIKLSFDNDGKFVADGDVVEETKRYILSCFKPYYHVRNLEALVGSQLTFNEIADIKPHHYLYLVALIQEEFDVIILDTNSSLAHVTTFPLLKLSKYCYYIMNLDFNNIRNNVRYKESLKEIDIMDKVRYVLNEDIREVDHEQLLFDSAQLEDSGFDLVAKVPIIPKSIFLNRVYEGKPVILDTTEYTADARFELFKVANQVYPIQNFDKIQEEYDLKKKKKRRFLR